jgi:hypothetical protein
MRRRMWAVAVYSALLGLGFFWVDFREALAEKEAVDICAARIRDVEPTARIWFTGYWGFQFYAEQQGMQQVVNYRPIWRERFPMPPFSRFQPGDYVLVPDPTLLVTQHFFLPPGGAGKTDEVAVNWSLPFHSGGNFYSGGRPLTPNRGPIIKVYILRVEREFLAFWPKRSR